MYNEKSIKQFITSDANILFFESVDSTNNVLKELAKQGISEGTTVVSRFQSGGKGTKGRKFYSPADTGIYLSVLLLPESADDIALLTPIAALAVALTIEEITKKHPNIKWVNDIILDGKKICGILCESSYDTQNLSPEYSIVGIGLNVFEPDGGFPDDIKDIAGAVYHRNECTDKDKSKSLLAAKIVDNFLKLYHEKDKKSLIRLYKDRLFMLGKRVSIVKHSYASDATALDIDDNCRLLVRYDDGREEYLLSGDISCKLK